jgi:hypothetical protein
MSYNFGTAINFVVVGLNVQGQDFYPQQIYLKPMIFSHHTEIYFKSTLIRTLQRNATLSITCFICFASTESS